MTQVLIKISCHYHDSRPEYRLHSQFSIYANYENDHISIEDFCRSVIIDGSHTDSYFKFTTSPVFGPDKKFVLMRDYVESCKEMLIPPTIDVDVYITGYDKETGKIFVGVTPL